MVPKDLCPVMLFSGKGGVGKTTLAAATAVRLARTGSRVLIVSTDPAHSLGDAFGITLAAHATRVAEGLDAMELDATGMFGEAVAQAEENAAGFGRLLRMASETPGVDEFAAVEVLLQAIERAEHDVVILDTAPTGHTLRLLALPELLDGWFGTMLQLRDRMARAGRLLRRLLPGSATPDAKALEQELEGGRDRIKRLRELLADPARAQIMLVTIPEAMSVAETARTLQVLAGQALPVGTVVVNQVQPDRPDCDHCRRRRAIHVGELAVMRQKAGAVPVRVVETQAREIKGVDALAELAGLLWDDGLTVGAL